MLETQRYPRCKVGPFLGPQSFITVHIFLPESTINRTFIPFFRGFVYREEKLSPPCTKKKNHLTSKQRSTNKFVFDVYVRRKRRTGQRLATVNEKAPTTVLAFHGSAVAAPEGTEDFAGGVEAEWASAVFPGAERYLVRDLEGRWERLCVYAEASAGDFSEIPLRSLVEILSTRNGGAELTRQFLRCYHIMRWRSESLYCGRCGAKNSDSTVETARLCPVCGRLEYPRICPAVITLVRDDRDRVLLAHSGRFQSGVYSLIAGFVEAGESLEQAAAREILEEVGLTVKDIRYVSSQPWPFPNSLMVGFCARLDHGEIRVDGREIIDARWCTRDELPQVPRKGSIARQILDRWLNGEFT
jgi:NAD+ diphosphatase